MQRELEAANPQTTIRIVGVNTPSGMHGNAQMCAGRDLPWLQDTLSDEVWNAWEPTYRDVIIVDADNHPIDVFNLTEHDLQDPDEYAALKALLLQHAGE